MLHTQPMIASTLDLAARANITFVGIGHLGPDAPLLLDGFISESEHKALQKAGAVGEICGWVFDAEGRLTHGYTDVRAIERASSTDAQDIQLNLSDGPISQFIRSLGLRKLVRYDYQPEFQAALYTPEIVDTP